MYQEVTATYIASSDAAFKHKTFTIELSAHILRTDKGTRGDVGKVNDIDTATHTRWGVVHRVVHVTHKDLHPLWWLEHTLAT